MLAPVSSATVAPASIKTHGSETRTAAGHQSTEVSPDAPESHAPHAAPTIGLSGSTVLSNVNAVTATAASRTVLQLLAFAIAAQVNISKRADESLDAFFLRLATTLTNMSDTDRASIEQRSGLKALNIRLTDLIGALKSPEGPNAARLVAMAEAPRTPFARFAATAATNSYLQEGQGATRSAETFSIEATVRSNESGLASANSNDGARGLQSQLKAWFEPGATATEVSTPKEPLAEVGDAIGLELADEQFDPVNTPDTTEHTAETVDESIARADYIQNVPDAVAETAEVLADIIVDETLAFDVVVAAETPIEQAVLPESGLPAISAVSVAEADLQPQPASGEPAAADLPDVSGAARTDKLLDSRQADKLLAADRRVETLLTLKGFAEVAVVEQQPNHIVSQPDPTDPWRRHAVGNDSPAAVVQEALAKIEKAVASATQAIHRQSPQSVQPNDVEESAEAAIGRQAAAEQEKGAGPRVATAEIHRPAKTAVNPELVPFAYAPLQPAKDEFEKKALEDERHQDDDGDETNDEQTETGEERRERLARKATDDLLNAEPEEPQTISISRDSSESDRAYAMYQRMGGF
jgi:transcriptional regulator NrdR family protein